MLSFWLTIATLAAGAVSAKAFHAIHISFAQMEWKDHTISGRVSFYKDDYAKAVANWSSRAGELDQPRLRIDYLKSHLRMWTNGISYQIPMTIESVSEDDNSYIYQFRFVIPNGAKSLTLDDRALVAEYADQNNLVMLKRAGEEINHAFSKASPTFVIQTQSER